LLVIGDIEREYFDIQITLADRLQLRGIGRVAAAGEYLPSILRKLLG
jgi:hypothetical protein